jgi:hypothetical protein
MIERQNGRKRFRFEDENGALLIEGQVGEAKRPSPKVGWSLIRLLGLRQTFKALSEPYLAAKVVNPIGEVIPINADAQSYLTADTPVAQFFNSATDRIALHHRKTADLNFQPQFIEHFAPFRFVYLNPEVNK